MVSASRTACRSVRRLQGFGSTESACVGKDIFILCATPPDNTKRRSLGNNRCKSETPVTPSDVNPSL